ncbi:MAG TPA: hypothetical protein VFZ91_17170 [Allosphingosinicella sp.]
MRQARSASPAAVTLVYGTGMGEPGDSEIEALLADPAWLPHRVLDDGRLVQFVRLSREERRELPFLDERFVADAAPRLDLALDRIVAAGRAAERCHYVFHSAFCGSTLLARALDIEGVATSLQEPQALVDLARLLPPSGGSEGQRRALDAVLGLLQRPFAAGEAVVIKPGDFANPLIEAMLELRPRSRALLMYAPLPAFLLSIARRGLCYRPWARRLATIYRRQPEFETQQTRDLLLLTDLQLAAFLWLQHQARFARLVRDLPAGRVAALRADAFLAEPARTLAAAASLFELDLDAARAAAIVAGPVFSHHAKRPGRPFDPAALKREEAAAKFAYGVEIGSAVEWAGEVAAEAGVPMSLGAPLPG